MAGTWADGQIVQNDARHALCAIDCHGHGFRNKLKRNALFADVSGASNWITHSSYRRVIPVASWQKGFESMGQRRVVRMTQKSRPNVAPERSCFLEPGTWGRGGESDSNRRYCPGRLARHLLPRVTSCTALAAHRMCWPHVMAPEGMLISQEAATPMHLGRWTSLWAFRRNHWLQSATKVSFLAARAIAKVARPGSRKSRSGRP